MSDYIYFSDKELNETERLQAIKNWEENYRPIVDFTKEFPDELTYYTPTWIQDPFIIADTFYKKTKVKMDDGRVITYVEWKKERGK